MLRAVMLAASLAAYAPAGALGIGRVWYVNAAASGNSAGTSWTDAFADLHDALAVAQPGDEIWIAQGTYTPDRGTGDRNMAFRLVEGIALFGGFRGDEVLREERNPALHETILSGDLNGDDGPLKCADVSDCCQEHDYPGCDDPTCEAFVCGLRPECCLPGSPNRPDWDGSCYGPAVRECCELGGWNVCENSYQVLTASGITNPLTLDGLTVRGQYSPDALSVAALRAESSNIDVHNCVFRDNFDFGILSTDGRLRVRSSVFRGYGLTGLLASFAEGSLIDMVRFEDLIGAGVIAVGDITITNCLVTGKMNYGFSLSHGESLVDRCLFLNGTGVNRVNIYRALVRISNSLFIGNWNNFAPVDLDDAGAIVSGCAFIDNFGGVASGIEGGFSAARIENCLFAGGRSSFSAVTFAYGNVEISNSTFMANVEEQSPPLLSQAVLLESETYGSIRNSIFWGHPDLAPPPDWYPLINLYPTATGADVNYSIVQGWDGSLGGVGNSGLDPLFVDPDGADGIFGTEDDDLRLSPDSPAINAGDPDAAAYLPEPDLDGHTRILCGRVDLGAYEFGIGDYDCNRSVNLSDFAFLPACLTGPIATQAVVKIEVRRAKSEKPVLGLPGRGGGRPYFDLRASDFALAAQPAAGCESFDFNADSGIDLLDLAALLRVLSGP